MAGSLLPPGGYLWQAQHVAPPCNFSHIKELIQPGQDAEDQEPGAAAVSTGQRCSNEGAR